MFNENRKDNNTVPININRYLFTVSNPGESFLNESLERRILARIIKAKVVSDWIVAKKG
jgi:hypothetical protein